MNEDGVGEDRRVFLDWSSPFALQAADYLLENELDGFSLAHALVVVPTANAGRILRQSLLQRARDAHGRSGLLAPVVRTPAKLLETGRVEPFRCADRLAREAAWYSVLMTAPPASCPTLFPVPESDRRVLSDEGAMETARRLAGVRSTLAAAGLDMATVAKLGDDLPPAEAERWRELAILEAAFRMRMEASGCVDPDDAQADFARNPALPDGIRSIYFAGVPDPQPLVLEMAGRLEARGMVVRSLVHAPASYGQAFDVWGRPLRQVWSDEVIPPSLLEGCVTVCRDPMDQAARVVETLRLYDDPAQSVVVGMGGRDPADEISLFCNHEGITVFDPEGAPFKQTGFHAMLDAMVGLRFSGDVAKLREFLHCDPALEWVASQVGVESRAAILESLDAFLAEHLPQCVDSALEVPVAESGNIANRERMVRKVLEFVQSKLIQGAGSGDAEWFFDTLREITACIHGDTVRDAGWRMPLERMQEVHDAVRRLPADSFMDGRMLLRSILATFGDGRVEPVRSDHAVDLLGWLELHWDLRPHLVLAGCNDGEIPATVDGDAFLPDGLCGMLGLPTNASRFARDAYLLRCMLESRRNGGRIDVLVPQRNGDGDPRMPSRLLFLCPDEMLPERVESLTRESGERRPAPRRTLGWKLAPVERPEGSQVERLHVTSFASYLRCPFRFYLSRIRRARPVEPAADEMDARHFGTLCHEVLRRLNSEDGIRESVDIREIEDFLVSAVDRTMWRFFGAKPSLPLELQKEMALRRLSAASRVLEQNRREEWFPVAAEWNFGKDHPFEVAGMAVSGQVDLVERHRDTGALRIVDFKTADKPKSPETAHFQTFRKHPVKWTHVPEYAFFKLGGKTLCWTDLQLPLYLAAVRKHWCGNAVADVQAGYCNLPRSVADTKLEVWKSLNDALMEAAMACAEGVVESVRSGRFWPPAESLRGDDFEGIRMESFAIEVDGSLLQGSEAARKGEGQ